MATAEERHLTTLTASEEYVSSSMVDTNTGTRGVQIIDAPHSLMLLPLRTEVQAVRITHIKRTVLI